MSSWSAVLLSLKLTSEILYVGVMNAINIDNNVKWMYGFNSESLNINWINSRRMVCAFEKQGFNNASQSWTCAHTLFDPQKMSTRMNHMSLQAENRPCLDKQTEKQFLPRSWRLTFKITEHTYLVNREIVQVQYTKMDKYDTPPVLNIDTLLCPISFHCNRVFKIFLPLVFTSDDSLCINLFFIYVLMLLFGVVPKNFAHSFCLICKGNKKGNQTITHTVIILQKKLLRGHKDQIDDIGYWLWFMDNEFKSYIKNFLDLINHNFLKITVSFCLGFHLFWRLKKLTQTTK